MIGSTCYVPSNITIPSFDASWINFDLIMRLEAADD